MVKNLPADGGHMKGSASVSGLGRSSGVGNGNLLQYSCLGNSMDSVAWRAIVHGVAEHMETVPSFFLYINLLNPYNPMK